MENETLGWIVFVVAMLSLAAFILRMEYLKYKRNQKVNREIKELRKHISDTWKKFRK